ncbi:hypothetical protein ACFY05_00620 [Microtetraspora fusca]|uniref:Secreted protein n=1 Tax=Microtetraspora fusca TaxID=1997 RepID=A0ABW6UWF5_MICFU
MTVTAAGLLLLDVVVGEEDDEDFPGVSPHPAVPRVRSCGGSRRAAAGADVQWGIWLRGGRFVSCAVVCCSPNQDAGYRCPAT